MKTDTTWKTYTCRYFHEGRWWGVDIMAPSFEDAEARVQKLGNLQLLGEVAMQIPANPATGLLVRVWVALRNCLAR